MKLRRLVTCLFTMFASIGPTIAVAGTAASASQNGMQRIVEDFNVGGFEFHSVFSFKVTETKNNVSVVLHIKSVTITPPPDCITTIDSSTQAHTLYKDSATAHVDHLLARSTVGYSNCDDPNDNRTCQTLFRFQFIDGVARFEGFESDC